MDFRDRVENWVESNLAMWNGEEYFLNDRENGRNYSVEEFVDDCLTCFEDILNDRNIALADGTTVVRELETCLPEKYRGVLENSTARGVHEERLRAHYMNR